MTKNSSEEKERVATPLKNVEQQLDELTQALILANKKIKKMDRILHFKSDALDLLMSLTYSAQKDHADTTQTLKRYLEEVCKICKWPLGHIYFLEETQSQDKNEEKYLIPSDIWFVKNEEKYRSFIENIMKTHLKIGEGLAGHVAEQSEPISLNNTADFSALLNSKEGFSGKIKGAFGIPLFRYGRIFAVAEFFSSTKLPIKSHYLQFAMNTTAHIATIVERRMSEKKLEVKNKELEKALTELKQIQMQLIQASKMASLGQLAAGVAHEINNPVGYLSNNLRMLKKYVDFFKTVRESRQGFYDEIGHNNKEVAEQSQKIDFILKDIDNLIAESSEGIQRVADIVINLKSFARLNEVTFKEASINDCLDSTLKVIHNELKYKCEIQKKFSELPPIKCHPGQLNQVFMNILVNASQAIETKGIITIETLLENSNIIVSIKDTGCGISSENLHSIFEPFFTTKPPGIGTGLGLSISYGIIQNHGGNIDVISKPGEGTTFIVSLPIHATHLDATQQEKG